MKTTWVSETFSSAGVTLQAFAPILMLSLVTLNANDLNPRLVGRLDIPAVLSIAVDETHAYLGTGGDPYTSSPPTLYAVDVSNPAAPALTGSYRASTAIWSVAVSNSLAFLASDESGLIVVDVSDPSAPRRVGGFNTSGSAFDVFLAGSHAYIADGTAGLVVIDISNPASLRRVGGLDASQDAREVVVSGNYAYLADRFWDENGYEQKLAALRIMDVSDPANPKLVATHQMPGQAWDLGLIGSIAYVGAAKVEVLDVSNPIHPQPIGSFAYWDGYGVIKAAERNLGFALGNTGVLHLFDLSNPTTPRKVGGYQGNGGAAYDYAVKGRYGYLATHGYGFSPGDGGLQIVDLEPHANLTRTGANDAPHYAAAVRVSGNHAYVADRYWSGINDSETYGALRIMDISDPANPRLVGSHQTWGQASDLALAGNFACVLARELEIVDVTNPANPEFVGSYSTAGWATSIAVSGELAYLGLNDPSRIEVIDLSTPAGPRQLLVHETPNFPRDLVVEGQYLFLADPIDGLVLFDISDPRILVRKGNHAAQGGIDQITVSGSRAYASSWSAGLLALDVSDASQPRLVGSSAAHGWMGIAAFGDHVYGAATGSGVQVIDFSDPGNPAVAGGNSVAFAADLAISGDHVFVASGGEGLQVFRRALSDPQPLPKLTAVRSGSQLVISWPAAAEGAVLESAHHISPVSNWTVEPTPPVVSGEQKIIIIETEPEAGAKFFRLSQP